MKRSAARQESRKLAKLHSGREDTDAAKESGQGIDRPLFPTRGSLEGMVEKQRRRQASRVIQPLVVGLLLKHLTTEAKDLLVITQVDNRPCRLWRLVAIGEEQSN